MNKLDCCGDFCPVPLLKAKKEIDKLIPNDSFILVTDHSCVVESITEYFDTSNFTCNVLEVINGVWEITIKRLK